MNEHEMTAGFVVLAIYNLLLVWQVVRLRRDVREHGAVGAKAPDPVKEPGYRESAREQDRDSTGPVITTPGPEKLLIKCLVCKSVITYRVSDINDDYIACPGCGHEVLA